MNNLNKTFEEKIEEKSTKESERNAEIEKYYKNYMNYLLHCPEGEDLDRLWRH